MITKQPLLEAIPFELREMGEVVHHGERLMTVNGVMHRADGEPNGNGRIYPSSVLEREIKKLKERISAGETVFSQADHPTDGVSRISDTAAILREIAYDPATKEVIGTAVILPTQKGRDLAAIVRAGGKVGISARGFGTTRIGENSGYKGEIVQPDYSLVTYDFVVGQSTKGAVISSFQEQARALGREQETTHCPGCGRGVVLEHAKHCSHCGHSLQTEAEDGEDAALQADVKGSAPVPGKRAKKSPSNGDEKPSGKKGLQQTSSAVASGSTGEDQLGSEEDDVTEWEERPSPELIALMNKYGLALIPRQAQVHETADSSDPLDHSSHCDDVANVMEGIDWDRLRILSGLPPLEEPEAPRTGRLSQQQARERELSGQFIHHEEGLRQPQLTEAQVIQRKLAGLPVAE